MTKNFKIIFICLCVAVVGLGTSTGILVIKYNKAKNDARLALNVASESLRRETNDYTVPTKSDFLKLKKGMTLEQVEDIVGTLQTCIEGVTDDKTGEYLQVYSTKLVDGKSALLNFADEKFNFYDIVDSN
jgi:hypothetical protein